MSKTTQQSPFPLICVEKDAKTKVVPGTTRVQNYWGDSGLVLWMGEMKGAWGKGVYCAVQYDNPNPLDERRTDGTHGETRYCTAPAHTVDFNPLRHLYFEVNPKVVAFMREQFGDKVAHFHDYELVKVAIARQFDAEQMVKTMEEHLKWYETYKPDPSKEWFHDKVSAGFIGGLPNAWDREGNLLHFSRPGQGGTIDPADFVKEVGIEALLRNVTVQHEEMKNTLRAKGFEHHRRYTSVYDLKNLGSIDGRVMDFAKGLAEINKNHQLEIVNRIIMINAPLFFRAVFAGISIFMDERTKDKVVVLSSDFKKELSEYIDPKFWPAFAGGSNEEWLARKGHFGQMPPEPNTPVTHGRIGEPYHKENMFPAAKKKAAEKAKAKEEEEKKRQKEEEKAAKKAAK